ncbi:unnamed protein product [Amoebophrya sp. A120]|nr:unnamed protein product [Amoebophrya sp. A120]|eukprot:GSA120T00006655001.1
MSSYANTGASSTPHAGGKNSYDKNSRNVANSSSWNDGNQHWTSHAGVGNQNTNISPKGGNGPSHQVPGGKTTTPKNKNMNTKGRSVGGNNRGGNAGAPTSMYQQYQDISTGNWQDDTSSAMGSYASHQHQHAGHWSNDGDNSWNVASASSSSHAGGWNQEMPQPPVKQRKDYTTQGASGNSNKPNRGDSHQWNANGGTAGRGKNQNRGKTNNDQHGRGYNVDGGSNHTKGNHAGGYNNYGGSNNQSYVTPPPAAHPLQGGAGEGNHGLYGMPPGGGHTQLDFQSQSQHQQQQFGGAGNNVNMGNNTSHSLNNLQNLNTQNLNQQQLAALLATNWLSGGGGSANPGGNTNTIGRGGTGLQQAGAASNQAALNSGALLSNLLQQMQHGNLNVAASPTNAAQLLLGNAGIINQDSNNNTSSSSGGLTTSMLAGGPAHLQGAPTGGVTALPASNLQQQVLGQQQQIVNHVAATGGATPSGGPIGANNMPLNLNAFQFPQQNVSTTPTASGGSMQHHDHHQTQLLQQLAAATASGQQPGAGNNHQAGGSSTTGTNPVMQIDPTTGMLQVSLPNQPQAQHLSLDVNALLQVILAQQPTQNTEQQAVFGNNTSAKNQGGGGLLGTNGNTGPGATSTSLSAGGAPSSATASGLGANKALLDVLTSMTNTIQLPSANSASSDQQQQQQTMLAAGNQQQQLLQDPLVQPANDSASLLRQSHQLEAEKNYLTAQLLQIPGGQQRLSQSLQQQLGGTGTTLGIGGLLQGTPLQPGALGGAIAGSMGGSRTTTTALQTGSDDVPPGSAAPSSSSTTGDTNKEKQNKIFEQQQRMMEAMRQSQNSDPGLPAPGVDQPALAGTNDNAAPAVGASTSTGPLLGATATGNNAAASVVPTVPALDDLLKTEPLPPLDDGRGVLAAQLLQTVAAGTPTGAGSLGGAMPLIPLIAPQTNGTANAGAASGFAGAAPLAPGMNLSSHQQTGGIDQAQIGGAQLTLPIPAVQQQGAVPSGGASGGTSNSTLAGNVLNSAQMSLMLEKNPNLLLQPQQREQLSGTSTGAAGGVQQLNAAAASNNSVNAQLQLLLQLQNQQQRGGGQTPAAQGSNAAGSMLGLLAGNMYSAAVVQQQAVQQGGHQLGPANAQQLGCVATTTPTSHQFSHLTPAMFPRFAPDVPNLMYQQATGPLGTPLSGMLHNAPTTLSKGENMAGEHMFDALAMEFVFDPNTSLRICIPLPRSYRNGTPTRLAGMGKISGRLQVETPLLLWRDPNDPMLGQGPLDGNVQNCMDLAAPYFDWTADQVERWYVAKVRQRIEESAPWREVHSYTLNMRMLWDLYKRTFREDRNLSFSKFLDPYQKAYNMVKQYSEKLSPAVPGTLRARKWLPCAVPGSPSHRPVSAMNLAEMDATSNNSTPRKKLMRRKDLLRVMSFNLLSQHLSDQFNFQFVVLEEGRGDCFSWPLRFQLIAQELERWEADIICLQEIDHNHVVELQDRMKTCGYKVATSHRRTENSKDMLLVLYKEGSGKLKLIGQPENIFLTPHKGRDGVSQHMTSFGGLQQRCKFRFQGKEFDLVNTHVAGMAPALDVQRACELIGNNRHNVHRRETASTSPNAIPKLALPAPPVPGKGVGDGKTTAKSSPASTVLDPHAKTSPEDDDLSQQELLAGAGRGREKESEETSTKPGTENTNTVSNTTSSTTATSSLNKVVAENGAGATATSATVTTTTSSSRDHPATAQHSKSGADMTQETSTTMDPSPTGTSSSVEINQERTPDGNTSSDAGTAPATKKNPSAEEDQAADDPSNNATDETPPTQVAPSPVGSSGGRTPVAEGNATHQMTEGKDLKDKDTSRVEEQVPDHGRNKGVASPREKRDQQQKEDDSNSRPVLIVGDLNGIRDETRCVFEKFDSAYDAFVLNDESVMENGEKSVTTAHNDTYHSCGELDKILFTRPFAVAQVLQIFDEERLSCEQWNTHPTRSMPNADWPSDHISLVADLFLMDADMERTADQYGGVSTRRTHRPAAAVDAEDEMSLLSASGAGMQQAAAVHNNKTLAGLVDPSSKNKTLLGTYQQQGQPAEQKQTTTRPQYDLFNQQQPSTSQQQQQARIPVIPPTPIAGSSAASSTSNLQGTSSQQKQTKSRKLVNKPLSPSFTSTAANSKSATSSASAVQKKDGDNAGQGSSNKPPRTGQQHQQEATNTTNRRAKLSAPLPEIPQRASDRDVDSQQPASGSGSGSESAYARTGNRQPLNNINAMALELGPQTRHGKDVFGKNLMDQYWKNKTAYDLEQQRYDDFPGAAAAQLGLRSSKFGGQQAHPSPGNKATLPPPGASTKFNMAGKMDRVSAAYDGSKTRTSNKHKDTQEKLKQGRDEIGTELKVWHEQFSKRVNAQSIRDRAAARNANRSKVEGTTSTSNQNVDDKERQLQLSTSGEAGGGEHQKDKVADDIKEETSAKSPPPQSPGGLIPSPVQGPKDRATYNPSSGEDETHQLPLPAPISTLPEQSTSSATSARPSSERATAGGLAKGQPTSSRKQGGPRTPGAAGFVSETSNSASGGEQTSSNTPRSIPEKMMTSNTNHDNTQHVAGNKHTTPSGRREDVLVVQNAGPDSSLSEMEDLPGSSKSGSGDHLTGGDLNPDGTSRSTGAKGFIQIDYSREMGPAPPTNTHKKATSSSAGGPTASASSKGGPPGGGTSYQQQASAKDKEQTTKSRALSTTSWGPATPAHHHDGGKGGYNKSSGTSNLMYRRQNSGNARDHLTFFDDNTINPAAQQQQPHSSGTSSSGNNHPMSHAPRPMKEGLPVPAGLDPLEWAKMDNQRKKTFYLDEHLFGSSAATTKANLGGGGHHNDHYGEAGAFRGEESYMGASSSNSNYNQGVGPYERQNSRGSAGGEYNNPTSRGSSHQTAPWTPRSMTYQQQPGSSASSQPSDKYHNQQAGAMKGGSSVSSSGPAHKGGPGGPGKNNRHLPPQHQNSYHSLSQPQSGMSSSHADTRSNYNGGDYSNHLQQQQGPQHNKGGASHSQYSQSYGGPGQEYSNPVTSSENSVSMSKGGQQQQHQHHYHGQQHFGDLQRQNSGNNNYSNMSHTPRSGKSGGPFSSHSSSKQTIGGSSSYHSSEQPMGNMFNKNQNQKGGQAHSSQMNPNNFQMSNYSSSPYSQGPHSTSSGKGGGSNAPHQHEQRQHLGSFASGGNNSKGDNYNMLPNNSQQPQHSTSNPSNSTSHRSGNQQAYKGGERDHQQQHSHSHQKQQGGKSGASVWSPGQDDDCWSHVRDKQWQEDHEHERLPAWNNKDPPGTPMAGGGGGSTTGTVAVSSPPSASHAAQQMPFSERKSNDKQQTVASSPASTTSGTIGGTTTGGKNNTYNDSLRAQHMQHHQLQQRMEPGTAVRRSPSKPINKDAATSSGGIKSSSASSTSGKGAANSGKDKDTSSAAATSAAPNKAKGKGKEKQDKDSNPNNKKNKKKAKNSKSSEALDQQPPESTSKALYSADSRSAASSSTEQLDNKAASSSVSSNKAGNKKAKAAASTWSSTKQQEAADASVGDFLKAQISSSTSLRRADEGEFSPYPRVDTGIAFEGRDRGHSNLSELAVTPMTSIGTTGKGTTISGASTGGEQRKSVKGWSAKPNRPDKNENLDDAEFPSLAEGSTHPGNRKNKPRSSGTNSTSGDATDAVKNARSSSSNAVAPGKSANPRSSSFHSCRDQEHDTGSRDLQES